MWKRILGEVLYWAPLLLLLQLVGGLISTAVISFGYDCGPLIIFGDIDPMYGCGESSYRETAMVLIMALTVYWVGKGLLRVSAFGNVLRRESRVRSRAW